MKSLDGRNNIKIYNLSAGKSLPEWLSDRKKRKLSKRDVDIQRRIELIQDFDMPDVSNCVKVSPDGHYVLATGTYKPRVKCFEVSALSLKFERCFDSEVIDFEVLSEDYSKLVFLQEDRYLEFHNQGGRWFRTRIPKFGRDLAYHYPSCDLYIANSGSEIFRLNLNEGKFLNPIQTSSVGINKCTFNPVHYLFACGTEDGRVECWDPRSRHRVGILDCALHMVQENIQTPVYRSVKELGITSLAFHGALTLGVGTETGQILIYDIRSSSPLLVKDHMDGYAIKELHFHSMSDKVFSLASNAVKVWQKDTGEPHTSIESEVSYNDLCVIPDSGMLFLAAEEAKMQIYFLPSVGPAPKWCGHLDSLIEELEEEDTPATYDDYKFVTVHELKQLGLDSLIGTNVLRAVMHGYYVDVRLYKKAKLTSNVLDRDAILKKKIKQKVLEQNERTIAPSKLLQKSLPDVNKEYFLNLKDNEHRVSGGDKSQLATEVLNDDRFGSMFTNPDAEFDKESEAFNLIQPLTGKAPDRFKQLKDDSDSDDEKPPSEERKDALESENDSDSDSIVSAEESVSENESEESVSEDDRESKEMPKTSQTKQKNLKKKHPQNTSTRSNRQKLASEFTSVNSFDELENDDWRIRKKMALGARLENESRSDDGTDVEEGEEKADEDSRKQGQKGKDSYGKRELKFEFKDSKVNKFEKLRQEQRQHQLERRKFVRNTKKLKGKIRMNKPFV